MNRRDDPTPALWLEDYGGILHPAAPPAPAPAVDPRARHDGPETSHPAAPNLRERVRRFITQHAHAGATCEATATALGLRMATANARINELARAGLIRDSDRRRPTTSGRAAIFWIGVDASEGIRHG